MGPAPNLYVKTEMARLNITRTEIKSSLSGYQIWAYAMHDGKECIVTPGIGLAPAKTATGCSPQKVAIAERVAKAMLEGVVFNRTGATAMPYHLGGLMLSATYTEPFKRRTSVVAALQAVGY